MASIELVVWDFDGVLNANVINGRFIWSDYLRRDLGLSSNSLGAYLFRSHRINSVMSGKVALADVLTAWLAQEGSALSAEAFMEYWFAKDALPDAEVIGWMQTSPMRHVIGTNNETLRSAYIENEMGFAAKVERLFSSGRMGVAKPEPGFYLRIADWAGVAPDRILMVDDMKANVQAAQALGWQGFHFTPETRADLPIMLGLK